MIKSLIYKEWIKTKWSIIASYAMVVFLLIYLYLRISHDMEFMEAHKYWNAILFMKINYFSVVKFFPVSIGLAIGLSQFVPELIDKRIKLTLHLPLNEERIVFYMLMYGVVLISSILMLFTIGFTVVSSIFFPAQITVQALISIVPWLLAGLLVYLLISFVVLEPLLTFKVFYGIVGVFMVNLFFTPGIMGAAAPAIKFFICVTLLFSISFLFSVYRFRKGEM